MAQSCEIVNSVPPEFMVIRDNLLGEFEGKNQEGLNVDRVHGYLADTVMASPYIFFRPEELGRIKEIDTAHVLRGAFDDESTMGLHVDELGLSLVQRDESLEKHNGTIFTEGLLVHEQAHAAELTTFRHVFANNGWCANRSGYMLPQRVDPWGRVLDEGWADMHRARYVRTQVNDAAVTSAEKGSLFKDGLENGQFKPVEYSDEDTAFSFDVPEEYFYLDKEGELDLTHAATAACIVRELTDRDPSIHTALREGRRSLAGLRSLAQKIERQGSGLYVSIQSTPYEFEPMAKQLLALRDSTPLS